VVEPRAEIVRVERNEDAYPQYKDYCERKAEEYGCPDFIEEGKITGGKRGAPLFKSEKC